MLNERGFMNNPAHAAMNIDDSVRQPEREEKLPNPKELADWKAKLQKRAEGCEKMAQVFADQARGLREKIRAVEILLNEGCNLSGTTVGSDPAKGVTQHHERPANRPLGARPTRSEQSFTPMESFTPVILSSLVELGGHGTREQVTDRVGKKLDDSLTKADWETLPSGSEIRWRNRVAWQRNTMVKQGLLRKDSPYGIWEIADAGRRWFADFKEARDQ